MSEPEARSRSSPTSSRDRREKLERIREAGIDPFPHEFGDREDIAEVRAAHEGLAPGIETESRHRVAGRIVGRRGHGKACFLDLRDGSGQIQLHAREDLLGEEAYELLVDLDLGDIVGVEGTALATRRGGELSLAIDHWRLLAKSLRPPPDKFHGLEDVETRYRRRELDLIANEESRRALRASAPARSPRSAAGSTSTASSRSRRRSCSRSTAAPWRGPSPPTTTRSTATSTCGSPPSSTSSGSSSAASTASTSWARTSATRASPTSTTPSSRCSSGTRPTPTTRRPRTSSSCWSPRSPSGCWARPGRARRGRDRLRAALEADHPARGDPRADRHRHRRAPDPRGAGQGDRDRARPEGGLGQAGRRPALQAGRAGADPADLRPRLPGRALALRQGAPLRGGPGRALGGLRRRGRDRQLLHRAQRPRRAAPPLRAAGGGARARRRRGPALRRGISSRRSNRACRRPAASASGSTAW